MVSHPNRGSRDLIKYKLVTQDYTTHNDTKWRDAKGKWLKVEAKGNGTVLCSGDVIHYYDHPVLAVIFNCRHANINNPRLLEIRIDKTINHDGLKGGSKTAIALKELPLPVISTEHKVEFAIRISIEVMAKVKIQIPEWLSWANDWLAGKNRKDKDAALKARIAAYAVAYAAADSAAAAAYAAADAADSAADLAATYAAADATATATAAAAAASAAAYAAYYPVKMFLGILKTMKLDIKVKVEKKRKKN